MGQGSPFVPACLWLSPKKCAYAEKPGALFFEAERSRGVPLTAVRPSVFPPWIFLSGWQFPDRQLSPGLSKRDSTPGGARCATAVAGALRYGNSFQKTRNDHASE